jgi:hypothetical protein
MSFRRKPESIQLGLDARFRGHDNSFFILNTQSSPLPGFSGKMSYIFSKTAGTSRWSW